MKYFISILLLLSTFVYSQDKTEVQKRKIFKQALNISETQIKNFLIKEQNKFCNYKSILLTEVPIVIDSNKYVLKSNYDLISNIDNSDEMLSGITKFPFFDESSWIFSKVENKMIYSSITSNNSSIEQYLQSIELRLDTNMTEIYELRGKIYTKLTLFEKDCEYVSYVAKYEKYQNIFLPDTVAYYSKTDTLKSSPLVIVKSIYKFDRMENIKSERCWEKNIDCSSFKIVDDEILLKKFFKEKIFEEKNCFITDEVLQSQKNYDHIGASIDPSINVTYKLLKKYQDSNIWKVTLLDSMFRGIDYYTEVKTENNNVKISRIRAFTLPGFYYLMVDSLLDSKKIEERKLAHDILLWTSTDDSLMLFFRNNQKDFLNLSLQLDNEPTWDRIMRIEDDSSSRENNKINELLEYLRINSVYKEEQYPGIIIYNLGGWLDNEVGYIECKNNSILPEVLRSRFILIEKITENWYLYKTT